MQDAAVAAQPARERSTPIAREIDRGDVAPRRAALPTAIARAQAERGQHQPPPRAQRRTPLELGMLARTHAVRHTLPPRMNMAPVSHGLRRAQTLGRRGAENEAG